MNKSAVSALQSAAGVRLFCSIFWQCYSLPSSLMEQICSFNVSTVSLTRKQFVELLHMLLCVPVVRKIKEDALGVTRTSEQIIRETTLILWNWTKFKDFSRGVKLDDIMFQWEELLNF